MSKSDDIYNSLTGAIARQQAVPAWTLKPNPAQDALTNSALQGYDFFQKGDFSSLPKGMFFNFDMPAEALDRYKKFANVNQGGTFALANNGGSGRSQASALQNKFLQDRFARDSSQNYQNNISSASGAIQGALGQASNAHLQSQGLDLQGRSVNNASNMGIIAALAQLNANKKPSFWGSILPFLGKFGADAAQAFAGGD